MKIIGAIFLSILGIMLSGCGRTTIDPTYFEGYYGANWTTSRNIIAVKREFIVRLGGDPDGGNQVDSVKQFIKKIEIDSLNENLLKEIDVWHEIIQVLKNVDSQNFGYIKLFPNAGFVPNLNALLVYYEGTLKCPYLSRQLFLIQDS